MADKNKVSGHIAPHSVTVAMQGPGTVSLSTTQQVVGSGEVKPDHTVSMVKDTGGCKGPECSMVNVKSGKHKTLVQTWCPSTILAQYDSHHIQAFGHSALARVHVLYFLPTKMVFGQLEYPVFEHSTILTCQCQSPGTSVWALSVNTAFVVVVVFFWNFVRGTLYFLHKTKNGSIH